MVIRKHSPNRVPFCQEVRTLQEDCLCSGTIGEVAALTASETKKTGSFTIPGIEKLVLVKRKARMGRNPATGATIKIPAKTVVKIRVAKAAKEAIVPKKGKGVRVAPFSHPEVCLRDRVLGEYDLVKMGTPFGVKRCERKKILFS